MTDITLTRDGGEYTPRSPLHQREMSAGETARFMEALTRDLNHATDGTEAVEVNGVIALTLWADDEEGGVLTGTRITYQPVRPS